MSSSAYSARGAVKAQVMEGIAKIRFPKPGRTYTAVDANQLTLGADRVLRGIFNPFGGNQGMRLLLRSSTDPTTPSMLSAIKTTDVATIESILAESKAEADAKNAAKGAGDADFAPLIATLADARDEVDRRNEMFQSVIGAKEGLAEALALKVGDRIVDAVTKTTDGYQEKNIDDWECSEIITRIQQGAARSLCKDVLQKVKAALGFKFDHRLQFSENLRNLRGELAKLEPHGITIGHDVIALIVLAEAEEAMNATWGREIASAMDIIRGMYGASHQHTAASLSAIMEELRKADSIRNHKLAPAPATEDDTESACLADSVMRKLFLDDESSEDGTAATAGAGYSSDSSEETAATAKGSNPAARRDKSKAAKARGRSSSRRPSEEQTAESNPCKHCRKHGRHLRHPKVSSSKCFWNKKYKGFRPSYVCKKLKLRFKPRADFPAALGGYPSDSDAETTSDEE